MKKGNEWKARKERLRVDSNLPPFLETYSLDIDISFFPSTLIPTIAIFVTF